MATIYDRMKQEHALNELKRQGYTITPPPREDGRPRTQFQEEWQKFAQDREAREALLDRSRPKPAWMEGREEQVLQELSKELMGYMDYQHPFGR